MSYDPLSEVVDEPLSISTQSIEQFSMLRASEKFTDLPGMNVEEEQARLSQVLNDLLDNLIAEVVANSSKLWVMRQFQLSLETVEMEDTEGREQFGTYLEQVMDILHIESSDGLLGFYL
jgi:hypothetical protein